MNHCQKCGNRTNESDKFCQNCGARIEIQNHENGMSAPAAPPNTGEPYRQYQGTSPDLRRKSSGNSFLLTGIFAVLFILLAGGGITAYFLFMKNSVETSEDVRKDDTKEKTGIDKTSENPDLKRKKESSGTDDNNENTVRKQITNSGDCGDYTELSERKISPEELAEMPKSELRIMRNEIFMRHGMKFKSKDLQDHFSQYDCYQPLHDDVTQFLTEIEKYNLDLIKKYEK